MGIGSIVTGSACALACAQAAFLSLTSQRDAPGHEAYPQGWLFVSFLLLISACFHLLSLDILWSDILREWLRSHGWYVYRRIIQSSVIVLLVVVVLFICSFFYSYMARRKSLWVWLCLVFSLLVSLSSIMRLVSWHTTDAFLNWPIGGMTAGRMFELSALFVILLVINSRLLSRWSWS